MCAAMGGHHEIVKLLLATDGINLNSMDTHGDTPLSLAAWFGEVDVVELLLAADGIDVAYAVHQFDRRLLDHNALNEFARARIRQRYGELTGKPPTENYIAPAIVLSPRHFRR
jgi:ankyrin repeat protein